MATGVKRFKLPDEFNYIKIYRQIADEPKNGLAIDALQALAQIFENRRQYIKAAELWERAIKAANTNQHLKTTFQAHRSDPKNWGRFDPVRATGR